MKNNLFFVIFIFCLVSNTSVAQIDYFITVSADGTGDYLSLQSAIDHTKAFPDDRITIFLKKGVYHEKIKVYSWNTHLTIKGEDKENTIIIFEDHFDKIDKGRNSTFHTPTLSVEANDCRLENLTIINEAGLVGQAIALAVTADRVVIKNCVIKGHQDTLYCAGEGFRQYFYNCTIEGTTDFIFGEATAVFERSTIRCLANSYITAASTPEDQKFGFVFLNCDITAIEEVSNVFLGRPWRPYAKTVFINCDLGSFINPKGWHDWSKSKARQTTFYAEHGNTGPGSNMEKRVGWVYKLTKKKLKNILSKTFFLKKDRVPNGMERIIKLFVFQILLYLSCFSIHSQQYNFQRDTSYTINSAFKKIKKDYPEVTKVTASNPKTIIVKKDLIYTSDPRPISLDLYSPIDLNDNYAPAILMIFGGGWKSGQKENLEPMAQKLAEAGFVSIVADYRLSPEAKFPAAVYDLKNAIRWIKKEAEYLKIDTNKIAVLGCSAGAQLATLLGVIADNSELDENLTAGDPSTKVNAIINIDGIVAFIHPESKEGKVAAEWLGGDQSNAIDNWELASPLTHVDRNSPPILFINSSRPRFHAGRDDMIKILNQSGIYYKVHTFKNSPHSFWHVNPWFTPTVELVINFLREIF
ncbi:pectinesterase family protein [Mangrovivirga cuniculi]|uniref:Pectinesterase n=1 Tax=Mangrovivirga cuniculi TaxID=2715131 RepID=A0A4D7JPH8_9BACT|nr:pectinesterase family protein [Mangrovivirga cuniculi]QCK13286.1 pectin esterase [Mangrovivirga cuniculi]